MSSILSNEMLVLLHFNVCPKCKKSKTVMGICRVGLAYLRAFKAPTNLDKEFMENHAREFIHLTEKN